MDLKLCLLLVLVSATIIIANDQNAEDDDSSEGLDIKYTVEDSENRPPGGLFSNFGLGRGGAPLVTTKTNDQNAEDDDSSEDLNIKYTSEDSENNVLGDLLSNFGLGEGGLLSSLSSLDLGPKGLGGILEKLNPGEGEEGSFPLFEVLKNPALLSSLTSGKSGRKLNLPIPPELSQDIAKVLNPGNTEEDLSAARKSLANLQKAYMDYVNIFNPKAVDEENELEQINQILVSTSDGVIRGISVDENDVKYQSFLGIPYAEKPVRFQVSLSRLYFADSCSFKFVFEIIRSVTFLIV